MGRYKKNIWLAFLFGLLILIRFFEHEIFYDPYLKFFNKDYLYIDSPRFELLKLVVSTSLRFLINTAISLVILFVFFKDISIVKFSVLIYTISYIILLVLFLYFVINPKQEDYYMFFNIRRFLIQPIMLLLLLPAFYYQRKGAK
ncbi:exosortase F system-associated protein [uncultured Lacinutrix sp.]|uniref:exosortase F system-associated membrane protein n=1 Tax=uncultured Lacinutrix sp. TaxID=574032 RepID=UPI002630B027|nr:exosortase F system-associated protein [uncultured Lacinutrix sp.]